MENSKKTWEAPTVIKHANDAVNILGGVGATKPETTGSKSVVS